MPLKAEPEARGVLAGVLHSKPWQIAMIGLGTAATQLDTAVNIAFPAITRAFGLAIGDIQWVVICYVLAYASLLLALGRIGDTIGHAIVYRTGLILSAGAFLLVGLSPSYGAMLFFRCLQGIGAALVLSCGAALVTRIYGEERRGRALGIYTMMMALGLTLGPLLGGVLVALWDWSAVFWFRIPIAIAALLLSRSLPASQPRAAREVAREHVAGRRVQRDQARLAELGASDRQPRPPEIDIPQLEVLDIAGAGHMVAGDRNDVFNAGILAFLERRLPAA